MPIKVSKMKSRSEPIIWVEMNKDEALRLIASLSLQIYNNDANSGRAEFRTVKSEYFSIGVIPEEGTKSRPRAIFLNENKYR